LSSPVITTVYGVWATALDAANPTDRDTAKDADKAANVTGFKPRLL
jgi:hypothetical protein